MRKIVALPRGTRKRRAIKNPLGGDKNGIPFSIQGTTSDPHFVPDAAGMAEGLASGALKGAVSGKVPGVKTAPTDVVGGILGRKKKN